jgi:protein adenylyltransferase
VTTGEAVERDLLYDGHPVDEPGAVVCRVAPTFLRFGSYEIHTARDDVATLRTLVRFTLERYYPDHVGQDGSLDIAGFFAEVARRTAWLVSEWLRVGFVHGVMNTDNMSILGLTIDYGPYGWIEPFDPDWTPNITDASGRRYRFGHQPQVAHWNVAQLARALVPLVDDVEPLRRTIERFPADLASFHRHTSLRKLGLIGRGETSAEDDALLSELGNLLVAAETDMTLFFRLRRPRRGLRGAARRVLRTRRADGAGPRDDAQLARALCGAGRDREARRCRAPAANERRESALRASQLPRAAGDRGDGARRPHGAARADGRAAPALRRAAGSRAVRREAARVGARPRGLLDAVVQLVIC